MKIEDYNAIELIKEIAPTFEIDGKSLVKKGARVTSGVNVIYLPPSIFLMAAPSASMTWRSFFISDDKIYVDVPDDVALSAYNNNFESCFHKVEGYEIVFCKWFTSTKARRFSWVNKAMRWHDALVDIKVLE